MRFIKKKMPPPPPSLLLPNDHAFSQIYCLNLSTLVCGPPPLLRLGLALHLSIPLSLRVRFTGCAPKIEIN